MFATPVLTILLSLFSTAVMTFISMAVPIGPWLNVTLVLLAMIIVRAIAPFLSRNHQREIIGYSAAASSLGGSIATACGFSIPTLYFLDRGLFESWMASPLFFISTMSSLVLVSGAAGYALVDLFEGEFLLSEKYQFPVGRLMASLLSAQESIGRAYELVAGMASSILYAVLTTFAIIPARIPLLPGVVVRSSWLPLLLAIGFVAGSFMTVPLAVGLGVKFCIVDLLQRTLFSYLAPENFIFAFCGGIVLFSALVGLHGMITTSKSSLQKMRSKPIRTDITTVLRTMPYLVWIAASALCLFLTFFKFTIAAQLYLLLLVALTTQQLLIIGGRTGMAPVGRFALWVILPGILLFSFSSVQMTLVAALVEISGIVAVDLMFGRMMGQCAALDAQKVKRFQQLGLVTAALFSGISMWLLIAQCGVGTALLPAQRCLTRALLINAQVFDSMALLSGLFCGFMLKYFKVNPTMVLTGILLPPDFSLVLIAGGFLSTFFHDSERWYPLWSGVFAASACSLILSVLW